MKNNSSNKKAKYYKMLRQREMEQNNDDQELAVTQNVHTKMSQTYISAQQSNKNINQAGEMVFDFDPKKILHLWLVQIIPGPKFIGLTYYFSNKKIKGKTKDCRQKIAQCEAYLEAHKLKLLTGRQLSNNQILYLKILFDIKLFPKDMIHGACMDLIDNQKFWQLKKQVQPLLEKAYIYLISVLKQDQPQFVKVYNEIQKVQITRSHIKTAYDKATNKKNKSRIIPNIEAADPQIINQDVSSQSQQQIQPNKNQQIKRKINDSDQEEQIQQFLKLSAKKQSKNKKMKVKIQQEQVQEQTQEMPTQKSNKKGNKKQLIYDEQFEKSDFNLQTFKKHFKNNKNILYQQFNINDNSQVINIQLYASQNIAEKKKAINLYMNYEKIIILEQQDIQLQHQIESIYGEESSTLNCCTMTGFVPKNIKEDQLRKLCAQNKINHSKSGNNTQKINVVFLKGIKSKVQYNFNQIKNLIKQSRTKKYLQQQQKLVTHDIILQLNQVQQYLQEQRVCNFVSSIVEQIISNHAHLEILNFFYVDSKLAFTLQMQNKYYRQFIENGQKKLLHQIKQKIICQPIKIFQYCDIPTNLLQKYLIFRDKTDNQKAILIQDKAKEASVYKDIIQIVTINNQLISTYNLTVKKSRLSFLQKFISDQHNHSEKMAKILKNAKFIFTSKQAESIIQITSNKKYVKKIICIIQDKLTQLNKDILQKVFRVSDFQVLLIQKQKVKFEKQIFNQFGLDFSVSKNVCVGSFISLGPSLDLSYDDPINISILKQKSLTSLPQNTKFFILSKNDLNFLQQKCFIGLKQYFLKVKNSQKCIMIPHQKYLFYYDPKALQKLEQLVSNYIITTLKGNEDPNIFQNYAFFMPQNGKFSFVFKILKCFYTYFKQKKNKIFIFQNSSQNIKINLQKLENFALQTNKKTKIQYFIKDGITTKDYQQQANKKIIDGLKNKEKKIYLTNQDFKIKQSTHLCSFKNEKIIHMQTKMEYTLQIYPSKVLFKVNGMLFQMPQQQVKKVQIQNKFKQWVEISLGIYEVDLLRLKQTNLFTQYSRIIFKKQVKNLTDFDDWLLKYNFQEKANEVQINYKYEKQQQAQQASEKLQKAIKRQKQNLTQTVNVKISKQQYQNLKDFAKNINLQIQWDQNNKVSIIGLEKSNILLFKKHIQLINTQNINTNKEIQYPNFWVAQKNQIQLIKVPNDSKQYLQVQKQFKVSQIKQLLRVQNKYLYKKFYNEKLDLMSLNGEKQIKQMKLYHGTHATDPKLIYEDKQDGFNVNHSRDTNYAGRGIYFAQNARYSVTYSFVQPTQNGEQIRIMFQCIVLVGDSQIILDPGSEQAKQRKITNYKNSSQGIRYESVNFKSSISEIYVVYKNRRAYPLYLIKY